MRIDNELALCPSDIEKDHVKAIKLGELKSWILGDDAKDGKELGRNLTVVLDCCFAAAQQVQTNAYQRVTSLGEVTTKTEIGKRHQIDLGSRVFCATGPEEQSYQALLGGYWYSAFTWAFTVALEQWQIHKRDAAATISHNELLFRTRMLLEALSFKQHPQLLGKFGLSNDPVFGHYDIRGRGTTSVTPNGERSEGQLNPDYKYTISISSHKYSVVLAQVVVVAPNKSVKVMMGEDDEVGIEVKAGSYGTEFWYVNRDQVSKLSDGLSHALVMRVEQFTTSTSTTTPSTKVNKGTFQTSCPVDNGKEWSTTAHQYAGDVKNYFFAFGTEPKRQIVQLNIAFDTNGSFLNGVQWYVEGPSNSALKGTIKPQTGISANETRTLASPAYGNRFYARTSIPAPW